MRIVVRCQDARTARTAQERLGAAGVEAVALPGPPERAHLAPNGQDVVIVDATETGLHGAAPFARALRECAQPPLTVLAGLRSDTPPPSGLEGLDHFSGAIALDASPALLDAQLAAAMRAGVAEEERARRAATAQALAAAMPKAPDARKLKAIYIGPPSPIFLSLERAFAAHGGLVTAAFSSFSGFDHLHDEFFDAVVLNGAQDPMTAISLCAALRRNASLHDLPTLMITAAGDEARQHAAIERGATAVVEVNASSAPALGWLFEAIRRERRRRAAEHELRALRDIMGDPRTGMFRREPFEAHLVRLAQDHHLSGRPLSLAALKVLPAHGAREPSAEAWRRGFAEIANLACRLVRDADIGVALPGNFLVIALPATDVRGARRSAERIASVAECTAFAAGDQDAGPLVFEQNAVELQPGESAAGLLARATGVFGIESARA